MKLCKCRGDALLPEKKYIMLQTSRQRSSCAIVDFIKQHYIPLKHCSKSLRCMRALKSMSGNTCFDTYQQATQKSLTPGTCRQQMDERQATSMRHRCVPRLRASSFLAAAGAPVAKYSSQPAASSWPALRSTTAR